MCNSQTNLKRAAGMVILALALLLYGYQSAFAADFRGGDTVVVTADEVIDDDLFVSGETVVVNGTVRGNLFASGADITVNGHVEGSLFMGGRTLAVNGVVDGSLYTGGYALTVGPEAAVGRNLYFGGFSLTTGPGSQVGRSLYGGGYQMILGGDVADDVNIGAGALELAGVVGGDVLGEVGNPGQDSRPAFMPQFEGAVPAIDPGLRVSEQARIGGNVNVEVAEAEAAEAVEAPFVSMENPLWRRMGGNFIALMLVGVLLLVAWPAFLNRTSPVAQETWLPSAGIGFLGLLVFAVAAPMALALVIFLAVLGGWLSFGQLVPTILGLGIGAVIFVTAIFLFAAAVLTKLIVAYTGGRLCLAWLGGDTESGNMSRLLALLIGVFVYVLLRAVPFGVGWAIGLVVTIIGLGAIYFTLRGKRQTTPAPVRPAAGTASETPA